MGANEWKAGRLGQGQTGRAASVRTGNWGMGGWGGWNGPMMPMVPVGSAMAGTGVVQDRPTDDFSNGYKQACANAKGGVNLPYLGDNTGTSDYRGGYARGWAECGGVAAAGPVLMRQGYGYGGLFGQGRLF